MAWRLSMSGMSCPKRTPEEGRAYPSLPPSLPPSPSLRRPLSPTPRNRSPGSVLTLNDSSDIWEAIRLVWPDAQWPVEQENLPNVQSRL